MIIFLSACFQINLHDWNSWEENLLIEDTAFEIQDFEIETSLISAGTFQMGCTEGAFGGDDEYCYDDEYPTHDVEITRDFHMMKTEVTQGLYEAVTGGNPSGFAFGEDFPVETVSWFDAVRFANELSRLEGREQCYSFLENDSGTLVDWKGFDCEGWRLPTEAEWEYAARGNENFLYSGSATLSDVAWFTGNSGEQTQKVAQKQANGFGLYDMSGNVWEWVWDFYDDYSADAQVDPIGEITGDSRVARGGGWYDVPGYLRLSARGYLNSADRDHGLGFRLVRTL